MAYLLGWLKRRTSYSTSFPATENPISEGGIWLNGLTDGLDWNDIQTVPGKAYAATLDTAPGGDSDDICVLKPAFFACTANQFSQATVFRNGGYSPSGSHEISLLVRFAISAHSAAGYEWYVNQNGGSSIVRWNGAHSSFDIIASPTCNAPANGDVFRMEISGTTITVYQNGVSKGTVNNSTFSTGNPGFGNNPSTGGTATVSGMGYSAWSGGNL